MNPKRFRLLFCLILIIFIVSSCKEKYPDEKLINEYVAINKDKFNNEKTFYLISMRETPLSCANKLIQFDPDKVIKRISDSLKNEKIFLLTDEFIYFYLDTVHAGSVKIIIDSSKVLDRYGLPHSAHLFYFKNGKIKNWQLINNY
jgi:hypothetical protein